MKFGNFISLLRNLSLTIVLWWLIILIVINISLNGHIYIICITLRSIQWWMTININKAYHQRRPIRNVIDQLFHELRSPFPLRSVHLVLQCRLENRSIYEGGYVDPLNPLSGGNIREGLIGQLSQYRKRPCPSGKLISKLWNKLLRI